MKGIGGFLSVITFIITVFIFSQFYKKPTKPETPTYKYLLKEQDNFYLKKELSVYRNTLDSANCSINTSSRKNSNGINMNIFFPCNWKPYNEIQTIPTLISQYINVISDSLMLGLSIDITKYGDYLSPETIKLLRTKEFLEKATKGLNQEFLKWSLIEMQSVKGDEITSRKISKDGCTIFLTTHLYYKNNIISIAYLVTATTPEYAQEVFSRYKDSFKRWIKKTKINNL